MNKHPDNSDREQEEELVLNEEITKASWRHH